MKIAMVSEHASPLAAITGEDAGGQNVHVAALSTQLARDGHDVTVWTRRDDPRLPARLECGGVTIAHVVAGPPEPIAKDALPRWMGDFADVLARAWASDVPDIVHAHFWMSGAAALRARPPATPVVQTFHALGVVKRRHQGTDDPSPPQRLATERTIALSADRVIATCRDEVAELIALDADPAQIDVVPCGVDVDRFTPTGPRVPTRLAHRIVVLGRLVCRKGVDDVVRALAQLAHDATADHRAVGRATELVIAGGPPPDRLDTSGEVRRLRGIATELGVADRVTFCGAVSHDDVPGLLRSADVVVCAPWYEPFGIVPLEAMACGVPVVATAVGGMLDSVVHGRTGLHVPSHDPGAIASALRRLLTDTDLRRRMGRAGRRRATTHFGWPAVAAETRRSYRRCLDVMPGGISSPIVQVVGR
ncbi:MAG: glycosyltransferase [Actinobacteria bacterium]|nr:glycosyltransferase [Actinomycetota bacterium]